MHSLHVPVEAAIHAGRFKLAVHKLADSARFPEVHEFATMYWSRLDSQILVEAEKARIERTNGHLRRQWERQSHEQHDVVPEVLRAQRQSHARSLGSPLFNLSHRQRAIYGLSSF